MLGRNKYGRSRKRIEFERMADRKRGRPERPIEQIRLTRRALVFKGLAVTSFATLTGRLYQLQIRDNKVAIAAQQGFSQRTFLLRAARGMIYDRKQQLLADNVKSWSVAIVPASLPADDAAQDAIFVTLARHLGMHDVVTIVPKDLPKEQAVREEIYRRLAAILGVPVENVRDPVEGNITTAQAKKRAPDPAIKVPPGREDLPPERVEAARAAAPDLPGVQVANPIRYLADRYGTYDPYVPLVVKSDVTKEVALGIEANRLYLPGVRIDDETLHRRYLVGEELGHILGYTGPITEEEYQAAVQRDDRGQPVVDEDGDPIPLYRQDDYLGKAGVEASLESLLRGRPGRYVAQITASGKIAGEFPEYRQDPVNGQSIVLSIDLNYQNDVINLVKKGIEDAKKWVEDWNAKAKAENRPDRVRPMPPGAGAAVALDPRTGEILALVSLPGYNPQYFAKGITQQQLDLYSEVGVPDNQKRYPLQNRCVANTFPPGSTLKTFMAAAGLQEGVITPATKFKCLGHIEVPNTWDEYTRNKYYCWTRDASHQDLDVRQALATSCDVFFYNVGAPKQQDERGVDTHYYQPGGADPQWFNGLGIERINNYLRLFGFGDRTGIELPDEVKGIVPGIAWKDDTFPGDHWSLGDTINTSIGQGYDLVTPLQLCNATAVVANRGTLYKPTLIHQVVDSQGSVTQPPTVTVRRKLPIDPTHLEVVRDGMRMNITDPRGLVAPIVENGQVVREQFPLPPGIDAGVKTGTAEYGQERDNDGLLKRSHAWCAAFAPYANPEICVVAFIEGGNASAAVAAPIASGMINAYFARKGQGQ